MFDLIHLNFSLTRTFFKKETPYLEIKVRYKIERNCAEIIGKIQSKQNNLLVHVDKWRIELL